MDKRNKKNKLKFTMKHRDFIQKDCKINLQIKAKTYLREYVEKLLIKIIYQSQRQANQKKQQIIQFNDIATIIFNDPQYALIAAMCFSKNQPQ
ncbi:hypothetical protein SS50377_25552 [Spironucleus salmonicida]|uniref:Uncharacterized protein n=1 Tax=Spironucleus salmonicida TaxID=348837 RepID=A0A9P8LSV8_9EUKA|nr:hypothetical protein SS50377_25552 [Spironucleus salmonicida]